MKCPHCSQSIGFFSSQMSEIGRTGACPSCGKKVKVGVIHTRFALGFIPVALVAVVLGLSGAAAAGIAGGVGAIVGLGLKNAET